MSDHTNAMRVRSAYEALWGRDDVGPLVELLDEDIVWVNDVGAGPWREMRGRAAVLEGLGEWMALFDGGFSQALIDVCGGDGNVVVILREHGVARGRRFENLALYRYEFGAAGTVCRVRTYDESRESIEDFWSALDPGATSQPPPARG